MNTRMLAAAVSAAILASGCAAKKDEPAAAPAAPVVDVAAEEQAIRNRSAEWMNFSNAHDTASIAALYVPESITIYDGTVQRGPDAIMAGLAQSYSDDPQSVTTWTTDSVRVAQSGDMALERGTLHVDEDGAAGKEPATDGAFVTVWVKVDGAWHVLADAGTDNVKKPEGEAAAPAN